MAPYTLASGDLREAAGGQSGRQHKYTRCLVVGDLTGVPLLKFAADSGATCIDQIEQDLPRKDELGLYDVVIVGAGIAGCSAAIEAKKRGLKYCLLEASQAFSTIRNFPKEKPIFAYPTDMSHRGELRLTKR